VQDGEQVVRVLVDLGALPLREHVLDVERMPPEPLRPILRGGGIDLVDVDPGEPGGLELSE
jgi:hypothetical protein